MNWSSQPPGVAPPVATAGLPSRSPVAISRGHRLRAWAGLMFAWPLMSGSLKPSRSGPSPRTWLRVPAFTFAAPQIKGTKRRPPALLTPTAGVADQV